MLAHSPPLPLTIDYRDRVGITARDEEGILLALKQRHRVRHLRLVFPVSSLQKLVMAIDEEFPILKYLIVDANKTNRPTLMLPETLQAPNLHHLMLSGFTYPIRSRFHLTAVGLVALHLAINDAFTYFQRNILLQWILFMPQLESLEIAFFFPFHNRDVERQLTHTHVTLPNLRVFSFRGTSAYLEALVCRITAPRLENLRIQLFKQPTFSVPHFPQFMNITENLRFDNAVIVFKDKKIDVGMLSREADMYALLLTVDSRGLDQQVSPMAQISHVLSQVFSLTAVEHLTLEHEVHSQPSGRRRRRDFDRIEWRNLLRAFSNVKTLRVKDKLVGELSRCLRLEDGEPPLELFPELQGLTYFGRGYAGDAFTPFIDARQNARRPVTLLRHNPNPTPSKPSFKFEGPAITSASGEAGKDVDT
jgi:hypothetical protein